MRKPEGKRTTLTWLQRRFVDEYMVDFNAKQASVRAGYSQGNTAIGVVTLNQPLVDAEIRRRCLKIQAKLEIDGDDVRRGFARIATDPREEAAGGPSWLARIRALRELGLLLGLYEDKIHITGSVTLVDLLLAADKAVQIKQPAIEHQGNGAAHAVES